MNKKVLFVSTHPDDETLGCGGTILRHKAMGDKVYWVIATSMKSSQGFSKKAIADREVELKRVAAAYRFDKVYSLNMPTMKVDSVPLKSIVKKFSGIFNEVKPNTVYLPFRADAHSDHRSLFEAAYSCTKTFRYPFIRKMLMMEVLSETDFAPSLKEDAFIPNYFVDISDFIKDKVRIAKLYKGEMGKHPFPRSEDSIKALATLRGSQAGCKYAESFVLLKEIR